MMKQYINVGFMLFASWGVYASCQSDRLLPILAGAAVFFTLMDRLGSQERKYAAFGSVPLSVLIIGSLLFGFFWRSFVPVPEDAGSPFPEFTAALQSGSVLAAVLIWLRPFNKLDLYRLAFCAWLTVGLSINVPFTLQRLIIFSSFCFIAIIVVILNTMRRPPDRKYLLAYFRGYVVFSALLVFLTTGLFFMISRSIVALDNAFLTMMSDFIMPRQYTHFLRISPKLNLISPGSSAYDRRPVLEVSVANARALYLKTQVFEDYENGTWLEPKDLEKSPLPSVLPPDERTGRMTMFVSLEDIIPSMVGMSAIKGRSRYTRDRNLIIFTGDEQRTRILEFSYNTEKRFYELSPEEYRKFTALPAAIAPELKEISRSIIGDEKDPVSIARKLTLYFHQNYEYSLDVNYSADDRGMLQMLREKRPAYCTYFASTLALLLRAEGIPSRVSAGFLTDEVIDRKTNTFIARVKHAHAWTQALLPIRDPATGQSRMSWIRLDATPSVVSGPGEKPPFFDLDKMFERMWLSSLRLNARLENIDKDKLKLYGLLFLVLMMVYINRQNIFLSLRRWLQGKKHVKTAQFKTPDALVPIYRRYERFLKEQYGQVRNEADTDSDVLDRIRAMPAVDPGAIARLEGFIRAFHASRFGGKEPGEIGSLLKECLAISKNMPN